MPTTAFDKESIKKSIVGKIQRYNGRTLEDATEQQIYQAVASTIRDQIMQKWVAAREQDKTYMGKRLYYLSVEFLMGRSLHCNAVNLCSMENVREALMELGINWRHIIREEPEPGLGNGGLGRLAACFMDSLAPWTCPPWAAPSAMSTACSVSASLMASRWKCPITGWKTETCGKFLRPMTAWS